MAVLTPNPTENLEQERDTARELIELLKEEREQLIKANIDTLAPMVGKKTELLVRLSALGKARLNALLQAGLPADENGMAAWLNRLKMPSADKLRISQIWEELHALIHASKELNRTNGLLIGSHMSRTQTALQVLQGNQEAQVYGKSGHTSLQTSRRSLVIG